MTEHEVSGRGWQVTLRNDEIHVVSDSTEISFVGEEFRDVYVKRNLLKHSLYRRNQRIVGLRGCKKSEATLITGQINYLRLLPELEGAVQWHCKAEQLLLRRVEGRRWISTEDIQDIGSGHQFKGLKSRCRSLGVDFLLTKEQADALEFLSMSVEERIDVANRRVMELELVERKSFFETIERTPLSEEQARAVVCFDNRVQVLAAAGSGKTSVMVARAAYAVERGFVPPERILLLAFNRDAALELQQRIENRFAAASIPYRGVKASTFHAFGLEVIGRATGKKPRLAGRLEQGEDLAMIMEIVDHLRETSTEFCHSWDLYRLLFASASTSLEGDSPDGYDNQTKLAGYRTFSGTLVKSHGERLVANFLFFNGVDFKYEQSYVHDVADETHSQYRPDFYYPDVDVWHEHWALDRDGKPRKDFFGYAEGMNWKRNIHAKFGTKLIETTWADVVFEDGLQRLQDQLTDLGTVFDWNPDRPGVDPELKPLKHEGLARLVRTFMCHVKSNSWSADDIDQRLNAELKSLDGFRTRLFLSFYWPIHDEWERRLASEGSVDFEDMLVKAADLLESGAVQMPYDLVLVDEFQDSSQVRARFVKGLLQDPGHYLLAVGDDWQSINRFAGADISVMSQFSDWFGAGPQHRLTTTFRCSREICDTARAFVVKNPIQIDKQMKPVSSSASRPVSIVFTDDESSSVATILDRLSQEVLSEVAKGERSGVATVDILGRYRFQSESLPRLSRNGLNVTFRTVHGSKGLEADFVIIPGLTSDKLGFPSTIADDPVLNIAMPSPDEFPHSEERRLLYVALTRARRGLYLIASKSLPSSFAIELASDPNVVAESSSGDIVMPCPECQLGILVERHGPYDPFLGCTRWPTCSHKEKVTCPTCHEGKLTQRQSKYGLFIGCSHYPTCRHTSKVKQALSQ